MNALSIIPQDALVFHHNQIRTTSIKVAEAFGKRHADVLRKVESIDCSREFASTHFCADEIMIDIGNGAQRPSKIYEMTKDGFIFLVMGFTGAKAAQVKEAYITAFNAMAEELAKRTQPKTLPSTLTPAQQRHIQNRVAFLATQPGNSFQSVWRSVKDRFLVGTYKDIPAERFPELCKYLGAAPLEGEYIEAASTNLPATGLTLRYKDEHSGKKWLSYADMYKDCWRINLINLLCCLKVHEGKPLTLRVEGAEVLLKEAMSLMSVIDSQARKLDEINRLTRH